jgi:hypothetical protein
MSPELLSRFEPIARAQLKQVVTNRISQFFAVDSETVAAISWLSLALNYSTGGRGIGKLNGLNGAQLSNAVRPE